MNFQEHNIPGNYHFHAYDIPTCYSEFVQHEGSYFECIHEYNMPFISSTKTTCPTEGFLGVLPNLNACSVDNLVGHIESSPAKRTLQQATSSERGHRKTNFREKSTKRCSLEKCDIQKSKKRRHESYHCPACEKTFNFYGTFSSHLRTHLNERPFACNICHRTFVDRSTLSKHRRVHTGQKPYACPICGQKFSQSGNMLRHKRKVHEK